MAPCVAEAWAALASPHCSGGRQTLPTSCQSLEKGIGEISAVPFSAVSQEGVKPFAPRVSSQPGSGTPEGRRGCSRLGTAG